MPTIDWRMRDALSQLRDNGRLNVLMDLILRANVRNRCWPSMDLICNDTGYALEAVNTAKKWLLTHGAIELVPYSQRVGKERDLPRRQHVYQLTGTLEIDGKTYPYLYIPGTEVSVAEVSPSEVSVAEGKVVKDSKTLKTKETTSASDDAHAQGDPQSEVTPSLKPTDSKPEITTPSLPDAAAPLSPKKARSAKQQANDEANAALVQALGEAYGVPATPPDETNYLQVALVLVKGTVPMAEFKWYFQFQNRVAQKGNYTIQTLRGYIANERISQYVKARNIFRAKQEKGEVTGAWAGVETQTIKQAYDKRKDPAYAYLYAGKGETE